MFGPDYEAGCPGCSSSRTVSGIAVHLANHDVMLWAVLRAPLVKLQTYKRRMGGSSPGFVVRQRLQSGFRGGGHRRPAALRDGRYDYGPYDLNIPEGADSGPLAHRAGEWHGMDNLWRRSGQA